MSYPRLLTWLLLRGIELDSFVSWYLSLLMKLKLSYKYVNLSLSYLNDSDID